MSDTIQKKAYYVTMTDNFMSGWGMSEGLKNKLVIGCDTYNEALVVANNAKARTDQKHINITDKEPYYEPSQYYVSYHDKNDYPKWFQVGAFTK